MSDKKSNKTISISFLAISAVLLNGCDMLQETNQEPMADVTGVGLDTAMTENSNEGSDASEAASEMVSQFQRDVESLRNMRNNKNTSSETLANNTETFTPPVKPALRKKPMFDDPIPVDVLNPSRTAIKETGDTEEHKVADNSTGKTEDTNSLNSTLANPESITMVPSAERLREAMVAFRRELYLTASYDDSPLRGYFAMAAMTLIDPEYALNPEVLYDLEPSERELLDAYQKFFINIGEELAASSDEGKLLELIEKLRQEVTETGPLTVTRAELCTNVEGFGRYTKFNKYSFLAGKPQQVVVYTEIDEFVSQKNANGDWVTDLSQELTIYNTYDNVPVWRQDWQSAADVSTRKLRDYFITHVINVPVRLTVGSYTLKVRVKDAITGSIAEVGIAFQIVADEKLAAQVD